jgi:hypothetical protein
LRVVVGEYLPRAQGASVDEKMTRTMKSIVHGGGPGKQADC